MLIKTIGLGGAERHVAELSDVLNQHGHEVTVVYTTPSSPDLADAFRSSGVRLVRLPGNVHVIRQFRALAAFLKSERPDIVHAHSPLLKALARLLRFRNRFVLVSTYHNLLERHHPIIQYTERLSHRFDDAQISCSSEVARSMRWSTTVVPNGIHADKEDTEGFVLRKRFGIKDSSPLFVCVASLTSKKSHDVLISAFAEAFVPGDAHLVLFGAGEMRLALENQAIEVGGKDQIHFAGADPSAAVLSAEADVFCLVSQYEGLPLALLEAMRNKLPCIVSDAGEMSHVVEDGLTGIVIERGDVHALAEAMKRLASDPDMRRRMGQAGYKRICEKFALEPMVDRIEGIYDRICSS